MKLRATIVETPGARRPFAVMRGEEVVELHADRARAESGRDRLNGVCPLCHRSEHDPSCPSARFELDPDFGSEYDETA